MESKGITELVITSGGKVYDPFVKDDNGLGVTILKTMYKNISCVRAGDKNRIMIEL